jgi:type II secretory pathway component GspD/PulD (secretin)
MKQHVLAAIAVAFTVVGASAQQAQKPEPPQASPQAASAPGTVAVPVRVQLVMSKYKGEKKVTSLPYTISAATGRNSRLRIGADAPYSSTRMPQKSGTDGQTAPAAVSFSYRTVGTAIDCTPTALADGRFRLDLTMSHDSISYVDDATSPPQGAPVFPTFMTTSTLVLKDGETGQLTVAADPLTGETVRVDVTLTVSK